MKHTAKTFPAQMGYTTSFNGIVVAELKHGSLRVLKGTLRIYPRVSDEIVQRFNTLTRGRNNTYGDGRDLSFDAVLHGLSSKSFPERCWPFGSDRETVKFSRVHAWICDQGRSSIPSGSFVLVSMAAGEHARG